MLTALHNNSEFLSERKYDELFSVSGSKKKSRLIVKKGMENILLRLDDIVLFYTDSKIIYTLDKTGKKYMCEENLSELEHTLDEYRFFRANRQYIINIDFVKSYKAYEKVKLQVDLQIPELNHIIIISQETAPAFRRWINQE